MAIDHGLGYNGFGTIDAAIFSGWAIDLGGIFQIGSGKDASQSVI